MMKPIFVLNLIFFFNLFKLVFSIIEVLYKNIFLKTIKIIEQRVSFIFIFIKIMIYSDFFI